ncbi:MAG: nucleotide exchange factor GrpE, partial [Acidobacteriota bacterium]|nr:nucleotide exchange factor GrpE [Acidobacteriota bacterium]
ALAAAEKSEGGGAGFNALLEGVRATANLFESKMLGLGLTAVAGEGEDFNPEVHEAVEIVPVDAEQDNKVIAEFQTGYKFGDRLLRPARVRVGRTSQS